MRVTGDKDGSVTKVLVIGGGAGGMLAAGRASECGAKVVLLERSSVLGKKLRITGKGRGNVTNTADLQDFIAAFGPNGKFLYSAFSQFSPRDLRDLLDRLGVPTKVERGGRVFPVSDRAPDVADALERWLRDLRVDIRLGTRVSGIEHRVSSIQHPGSVVRGVRVFGGVIPADAVILATGGITYPRTGSTGDGYRMAAEVGHAIIEPKPSLSALETAEGWVSRLQGLSLRNVSATLYANGRKVGRESGEMLFTHFGVSGPIILTLSKLYAQLPDTSDVRLSINLKPALTREQLDERLVRDFAQTRQLRNYLPDLLPKSLIPVFIEIVGIPADTRLNTITNPQRKRIIDWLVEFRLTVKGARSADEAIVTAGGVPVKEINPSTMESKVVRGLYLVGEVIDVDAITGGYNLQAAFSTGWVAGENAARSSNEEESQRVGKEE